MSGGGALMNIGIHYIDLLQWWLGDAEILKSKIGYFNRVIDESAYVQMKFGQTIVEFHINSRHNVRKIEYIAFWDNQYFIYDTDEATHYELFKGWMEGNYVTLKESLKSLELMLKIYESSN
jgi:predicted dehydrogenase